jgi:hypothetical protein
MMAPRLAAVKPPKPDPANWPGSYRDMCRCKHVARRHLDLLLAPAHHRGLAGECRDCDCIEFRPGNQL